MANFPFHSSFHSVPISVPHFSNTHCKLIYPDPHEIILDISLLNTNDKNVYNYEIKHALSVSNVVWNTKTSAFLFQTSFLHLGGYPATTRRTSTLFLFKIELIVNEVGQSVTSYFESCSLLHPRDFRNAYDCSLDHQDSSTYHLIVLTNSTLNFGARGCGNGSY